MLGLHVGQKNKSLDLEKLTATLIPLAESRKFPLKIRNKELKVKVERKGKNHLGHLNVGTRKEILKRLEKIHKLPLGKKKGNL